MSEMLKAIVLCTIAIVIATTAIVVVAIGPVNTGPSSRSELADQAIWEKEILVLAEKDRQHLLRNGAFNK